MENNIITFYANQIPVEIVFFDANGIVSIKDIQLPVVAGE